MKEDNYQIIPLSEQPVEILVTDDDIYGNEIAQMSDFMGIFASKKITEINNNGYAEIVKDFPVAEIGIVNEIIHQGLAIAEGNIDYILDFDSLPKDVKQKLDEGIYKIGDSRQVEGNLRAVIVNEEGIRVKDLTLKQIKKNPALFETTRSIINQLQMKQINTKLSEIQEYQSYALEKSRDNTIKAPFLNARDYILRAQNAKTKEERDENLKEAAKYLTEVKNAVFTEINTAVNHLADCTKHPLLKFYKKSMADMFVSHISEGLQISTKVCGISMLVYEYLGRPEDAKMELVHYQNTMKNLMTVEVKGSGYTALELVHDNFSYNKANLDFWYKFTNELKPKLEERVTCYEPDKIYILSVED